MTAAVLPPSVQVDNNVSKSAQLLDVIAANVVGGRARGCCLCRGLELPLLRASLAGCVPRHPTPSHRSLHPWAANVCRASSRTTTGTRSGAAPARCAVRGCFDGSACFACSAPRVQASLGAPRAAAPTPASWHEAVDVRQMHAS